MTGDELAAVRAHIGDGPPSDAELQVLGRRLGSVEAVALDVVRSRLAAALMFPAGMSVDGDHAVDQGENVRALERQAAKLAAAVAAGGRVGEVPVSRVRRPGRR